MSVPTGGVPGAADQRSVELLELPAVRERIAARCHFDGGAALAEALSPSADPAEVARRIAEVEEAIVLRDLGVAGPGGATDLRAAMAEVARGAVLDAAELAVVLATARVALELRTAVMDQREAAPRLAERARFISVPALTRVVAALDRALDPHGGIADSASPELALLRRRVGQARRSAAELLRSLAARLRSHLQEGFTTERAGRPVVAVKASSRSAVPGIVHDSSGSGATLFVEPLPLVEANNQVRELQAQEAAEVARILRMLSSLLAEERSHLDVAVEELAHLDLRLASAAVSREWDGTRVEPGHGVRLVAARHPLLARADAVPIDLPLTDVRALVVSGPNTGGKTVALKTLGLLALVHQCGLRVPAREATLPVFDRVLADIGDDQSIAESLSTFSAHVRRLKAVLAVAGERSLVLLDEPAAGTDPDEGARLAEAVISALAARGALVLATTHHPQVKEWASGSAEAVNASVAVDLRTLRPLYTLVMGEPGASHALGIAEGLGLDPAVIAAARALARPAERELEGLLGEAARARANAEQELEAAREARRAAERETAQARAQAAELESRLARSRQEAAAAKAAARHQAERELADAARELATLRREIAAARREEQARQGESAAGPRARERDRRLGAASEQVRRTRSALSKAPEPLAAPVQAGPPPAVGDDVIDSLTGMRGRVMRIRGDRADVHGGVARMTVPLERLTVDAAAVAAARREARRAESTPPPPAPTGAPATLDVDVRGQRAEAARTAVRERVDAAAVAGIDQLRVIHGHGTGALRSVIREELARHPLVSASEPAGPEEGGEGATIAHLG